MKILLLTNFFPPHHGGSFDLRCEETVAHLRQRGHEIRVLTSHHGLQGEQRDSEIERRLLLNGVAGHPQRERMEQLKEYEVHNHSILAETLAEFQPELVYVWSLDGLPKSFTFALANARLPCAYDVADDWIVRGLRADPWLRWWNQPNPPLAVRTQRALLESTGQRVRTDSVVPTRLARGFDRVPGLYGTPDEVTKVEPNSIGAFRFDRIYFCSQALKARAERAGLRVRHAEVIYPGVVVETFFSEVKPAASPVKKLLLAARLEEESGVMTALEALRLVRAAGLNLSLGLYGRGDSEFVAQVRSFAITRQLQVEMIPVANQNRDLANIFRQHDIFLHTPEWDEPYATTPLEAMAAGLPLVAARAGGLKELLNDRANCLLFTPGNATELAACIQSLVRDSDLRIRVAQAGQVDVAQKLNQTAVIDQIERFLSDSIQLWQQG